MKHIIIFANNVKEAKETAKKDHPGTTYQGVYKYSKGKGNNFYSFK